MSGAPFLVLAVAGAVAALGLRGAPRASLAVGLLFLAGALIAALAIRPGETLSVGDVQLTTTAYERLYLVLGALAAVLLSVIAAAAGWTADLPAASLIALGALSVALEARDPSVALLAALGAATPGFLVSMRRPVRPRAAAAARNELRVLAVTAGIAVASLAWLTRPQPVDAAATQPGIGLAFLGLGVAVALRSGVVPFHAWASHLATAAPRSALPLLLAWIPGGLAVVVLGWTQAIVVPGVADLGWARLVILAMGVATILLGLIGAWLQEEVEQLILYSIIQDAGFLLLALGSLDGATWAPARAWLVAFVVAKSAFAGWAVALRSAFGTGRISELDGWIRRAPILAAGLILTIGGTIGWPGLSVFDDRAAIVRSAFGEPVRSVVLLGAFASLAYYARLIAIGVRQPSGAVARGADERIRWPERALATAPSSEPAVVGAGASSGLADHLSASHPPKIEPAEPPRARAFGVGDFSATRPVDGNGDTPVGAAAKGPIEVGRPVEPHSLAASRRPTATAGRRSAEARWVAAREQAGRLGAALVRAVGSRTTRHPGASSTGSSPTRLNAVGEAARAVLDTWRLNRVPAAAALALILGIVAAGAGAGAFGIADAAAGPRPSYAVVLAPAPTVSVGPTAIPTASLPAGGPGGPAFLPIPTLSTSAPSTQSSLPIDGASAAPSAPGASAGASAPGSGAASPAPSISASPATRATASP